jgi:membrane-associated phospholipid phosphatase
MRGIRSATGELWRFALCFLGPALLLAAIAEEVGDREPIWLDSLLRPLVHPGFEPAAVLLGIFTVIGGGIGLTALAAVPAGYLVSRRRYGSATFIAAALGGAWAIDRIMKVTFGRPRPAVTTSLPSALRPALAIVMAVALAAAWPTRLRRPAIFATGAFAGLAVIDGIVAVAIPLKHGFDSFPSGHAVGSMTFAASMVIMTWRTRWRWDVVAAGIVFVVIVGISRIYFGLHYASDILGGWCLGVAWVALLARAFRLTLLREEAFPQHSD